MNPAAELVGNLCVTPLAAFPENADLGSRREFDHGPGLGSGGGECLGARAGDGGKVLDRDAGGSVVVEARSDKSENAREDGKCDKG